MLNIKKLLTQILTRLKNVGTIYTAAWTATQSSANNTQLTGELSLPAGVYILTVTTPVMSRTLSLSMAGAFCEITGTQGEFSQLVSLPTASTLAVRSAQSAAITFSYLGRGSFRAIRVS